MIPVAIGPEVGLKVVLEIKTANASNVGNPNSRVAAIAIRRRETAHRQAARLAVVAGLNGRMLPGKAFLPARVTMTRISAGELDDDGLCGSLKRIRDGIADALGIKDGPRDPAKWHYQQRKGPQGYHAVEILIEKQKGT